SNPSPLTLRCQAQPGNCLLPLSSFLIYNVEHNECVTVRTADAVEAEPCDPSKEEQRFRWVSEKRLLSISHKLCLGAQSVKDWVKVLLFPCDEKSEVQHWECKNDTLFGLQGVELHLNYGNFDEKNIMVYQGSGSFSRWQIYGTQENLCSHGYQEIFTTGGNGFGAPCQFPFKYADEWYAECTVKGRSDGQLWCATVTDYNTDSKWGFCAAKSGRDWDKGPVTGVLYQWNVQAALTWHQARKSCQQQGADLLSIVELHEQTYISGLMGSLGASLWIGLNSLDFESGWQWSNGSPFRYLNWAPGQPSSEPGLYCAVLNSAKASKWETHACSKKLGYICRKENSTSFCPSHWVQYAGNCYYLERTKKIWQDALSACHKEGGDLASIHNIEEQSFIISQLDYQPRDELWIGLNDQRRLMLFEWSDRSPVTFTKWQVDEPSQDSNTQEDCVLIQGEEGKWADHRCEKEFGYICKKKASSKPSGTPEVISPGCKAGWTRFGSYCYYVGSEAKTFDEAKQTCQSSSSYLVDVTSRYENAFLISLVGLRPEKYFWIGLSNTEERENFVWTNTKNVRFTHFNIGMPDRKQGCVAMTTGVFAGLWDVVSCNNSEKYICKHMAEGVVSTLAPPTTPPLSCSPGWTPLGNRNFCYKVENKPKDDRKTWFEAKDFCRAIGGDLVSIHGDLEIDNSKIVPEWNSRSVSYENWDSGEPNNYNGAEFCGEMNLHFRMKWNDHDCEHYNNWICQIQKGIDSYQMPTGWSSYQYEYNTTEDGWIEYNGSQYYINKMNLPMEGARAFCRKNSGDLVVITGDRERRFLWKRVNNNADHPFLKQLSVIKSSVVAIHMWVDGTPVSYVAWERNEPNFSNNDENCVTMLKGTGFWNDINCGATLPSICKRSPEPPINSTIAPTMLPEGGCPSDWILFQHKCYRIYGANQSDLKPWKEARNHCISLGGNLVSILSEKEQAFLTAQMLGMSTDMWIGLNDISSTANFVWTEGKSLYYTNWFNFHLLNQYHCVVMLISSSIITGLWKMEDCTLARGFICKKNIDPQINPPAATELPETYQSLGNSSFKVVSQKMNWDEARMQCKADNAELASIMDPIAQAFVMLRLQNYKEPLWIGLNSNMTSGYFHWTDNWRLRYSNWAPGEPKSNLACVYIDVDGKWKTTSCDEIHYSLCKRSTDVAPTDPPQLPGHCPESTARATWVPFRGHCYAIMSSVFLMWAHASTDCMRRGGSLLSIEDPVEAKFIQQNLEMLQDTSESFWVGLYKTHKGEWLWIDKAVVDYTNWLSGTSSSPPDENCVEILSDTAKWKESDCNIGKPYICKMAKTYTVHEPQKSSLGIAVAVVILILVVVGLTGFYIYKKKQRPVHRQRNLETTLYFNSNPSQPISDSEGLVANIEQDEQGSMI
uniref:Mannose receptor C-type 1 n=1 Tax=Scleropages formosus TaxID=113540 RepID=A0A8C9W2K6_SCLFO